MSTNKSILLITGFFLCFLTFALLLYGPVKEETEGVREKYDPLDLTSLYRKTPENETASIAGPEILISPINEKYGIMKPPPIMTPDEKEKLISFGAKIDDTTGSSKVRRSELAADLNLKVSEKSRLGLGVSTMLYDQNDSDAWKQNRESREQAMVKYHMAF